MIGSRIEPDWMHQVGLRREGVVLVLPLGSKMIDGRGICLKI